MSAQPDVTVDINSVFEATIDSQIDTLINAFKDGWEAQVESAKYHLDSIAKYEERIRKHQRSLVDNFTKAEETELEARDRLIKIYGAERVLPKWEAAGDLAPPGFRQALRDVNVERPAPMPAGPVPVQQAHTPDTDTLDHSSDGQEGSAVASSSVPDSEPEKRPLTDIDDDGGPAFSSRSKRTRTSRFSYPSRDADEKVDSTARRTIPFHEVNGLHWAFPYPDVGDGYFILLCNENLMAAHPFDDDPLSRHRAIRHFEGKTKKCTKCHGNVEGLPARLTVSEIVQKYGYQVEGMTIETCIRSNQRISDKRGVNRIYTAKGKNNKAADEPFSDIRDDLPKTRSSRPYGKPEIQPINRPTYSPNDKGRTRLG